MPKTKTQRNKIIAIFLAIIFLLTPLSFGSNKEIIKKIKAENDVPIVVPEDPDRIIEITDRWHQWKKDDNVVIRKVVIVREGASLIIEKGSVIKFEKEEGKLAPFIFVEKGGFLMAWGEESEKIVFTSDQENSNFSIVFDGYNDGRFYSGYFRYVEISKAGGVHEIETGPPPHRVFLPPFISQAFAEENSVIKENRFPIKHLGGVLQIENCRFYNNKNPDLHISEKEIDPESLRLNNKKTLVSVTNSNFENNETGVAVRADHNCVSGSSIADCKKVLYLKNNWYGKNTGPNPISHSWQYCQDHQSGSQFDGLFGAKVIGELIKINGFRKKDLIVDPVIIIPGIMGSSKRTKSILNNNLVLDPILHRYEDLIESLKRNGYEKDINLFEFPYDWRNSNIMTAQKLSEKISEIQTKTNLYLVDIVAHSMGGLVARQYIQGNEYTYDINQLITLGTPHKGSPQAYLQWEAAEGFSGLRGQFIKWHFTREAKHNGYDDIFSYIRNRVLSVKELLPDYDYLYDTETEELRSYSDDYPRNIFLENLNNINTENLDHTKTFNIAGNIEDKTIKEIKVEKYDGDDDIWEHGMPENFNNNPEQGLELGEGDETVPLYSAAGFNAQKSVIIDATHGELPTKAQCLVFKELTGLENCDYDEDIDIPNILLFNLYSPVDMQVIAPDGKRIGKDFETGEFLNEIDLAYYSGFDGEDEFITIPNPIKGKYKIKTQTTGSGDYKVEVVSMKENSDTGEIKEAIKSFDGVAESVGEEKEVPVNINEDGNIQTDETPPVISISSPEENKEYLNNEILNIDYEVSDNVSGQEDIVKNVFLNDELLAETQIDLSLQALGEYKLKVEAVDEAENTSLKEADFIVSTDINALTDNVNHYYELGLIKNQQIKRYLNIKLRFIERLMKFKQRIENHPRMHKKFKKRIVKKIDRLIKRQINRTVWQINKNKKIKKNIDKNTRVLIIEQLKYIKK